MMRKFFAIAFWGLCALVACQKVEEPSLIPTQLPASIEAEMDRGEADSQPTTKVAVDDEDHVVWSEGDAIACFTGNVANARYEVADGVGTKRGVFNQASAGSVSANQSLSCSVAAFPYGAVESISTQTGVVATLSLPATQSGEAANVGAADFPMIACSANTAATSFRFKNLYSVLEFQLKSSAFLFHSTITKIVFFGNEQEPLSGKATVMLSPDELPTLTFGAGAGTMLTKTLDTPIKLSSQAQLFRIAVPPTLFAKGFTVRFYDNEGKYMEKTTRKSFTLKRSTIQPISAFAYQAKAEEMTTSTIWSQAAYNTFTDLVRYNDRLYCVFREGVSHAPTAEGQDGTIRVIRSTDNGDTWTSIASIAVSNRDLRDPKLSIAPDGRMMLLMGGSDYSGATLKGCLSHVAFMNTSEQFTTPTPIVMDASIKHTFDWLWRVTWHKGVGYGVVYRKGGDYTAYLVKTTNGINYEKICQINIDGRPNEATVYFTPDDEMRMILRREQDDCLGKIGRSRAPFTSWTWKTMNERLGGPSMPVRIPNGRIFYAGRHFSAYPNTRPINAMLYWIQEDLSDIPFLLLDEKSDAKLTRADCGYEGVVADGNRLLVSYYTKYNDKTAIYLARIPYVLLEGNPIYTGN